MTAWTVEFTTAAAREVRKLEPSVRRRVLAALAVLEEEARPAGARKLSGSSDDWRIRIGDHRALYEIQEDRVLVTVFRVAHRREVYR
ncbi:type II toxin-antitoxin system RelE/ParE family toxin [Leifsonia sp. 71-9]|uniref:type II toxin-antitoxin system RelE family toxin n=1 Tax=Leifsonia sp. 71-9 TaxID=1895934 RepID=UPI00092C9909|nr:type II toxin-antitoxin system RelE/ParE family toxin [Leifsonia sp. 71-9]OJX80322.1 MAG: plasmid stabilization protein [Leifsonia sp. 71-9]